MKSSEKNILKNVSQSPYYWGAEKDGMRVILQKNAMLNWFNKRNTAKIDGLKSALLTCQIRIEAYESLTKTIQLYAHPAQGQTLSDRVSELYQENSLLKHLLYECKQELATRPKTE